jgi:DNA polymerase-3 subunit epsilon
MTAPAIDPEVAAAVLEQSDDYRVLRRLVPRKRYHDEPWNLGDRSRVKVGLVVDVETSGLRHGHDQIIEFAAARFTYDAMSGFVYEVQGGYQGFQEPTVPISDESRAKHHITDEMLKGQSLDAERITQLLDGVSLVIAYNSGFDRRMIEPQFPAFAFLPWGDACNEIDWEAAGSVGRKLENVLAHCCGVFYDAHRAMDDVTATLHALATADVGETPALLALLEAARMPTTRVWAVRSPFEMKDELKARGYKWADRKKTWYKDIRAERGTEPVSVELTFLECNGVRPDLKTLTAKDRYSVREDL